MLAVLFLLSLPASSQDGPPVFRAGFAEIDITPPMGTPKQGSNSKTVASSVLDPLYRPNRTDNFTFSLQRQTCTVNDGDDLPLGAQDRGR